MHYSDYRMEKDSLGGVAVPQHALYGAQTQRAVHNFQISDLKMPRAFIRGLGLIKSACAEVNQSLGKLNPDIAKAIIAASREVESGGCDEHFPIDVFQTGSGTSTNMNANEVIARVASHSHVGGGVHPNDHVNMGQSSNDVIPTCIHVSAVLQIHETLLPALTFLAQTIEDKAHTLKSVVKTGRTHLMDAMPITLEQEFMGWASQIRYSIQRVESGLPRLQELAIGGTAVGTGVNTPKNFGPKVAEQLSQTTGLPFKTKPNYFEALSAQDSALEMSGHLKCVASALIKISNDLRWMNSGPLAGLAEIELPALQPGSSIMPGKVNPVIPESVLMAAMQVCGNDTTITLAAQSGNFQLNVSLPIIAYNLLQSIELMAHASRALGQKCIKDLSINFDGIDAVLDHNPILVTALNEKIGYEKSAEIAKYAYEQKKPILEVAAAMTEFTEQELVPLLNPLRLTGTEED